MLKRFLLFLMLLPLSACYRNWPNADAFARSLHCDASKESITERARQYGAASQFLPEHNMLQVQKEADTVAVAFDPDGQVIYVALARVNILLFGLHRRQTDTEIVLRCPGRYP